MEHMGFQHCISCLIALSKIPTMGLLFNFDYNNADINQVSQNGTHGLPTLHVLLNCTKQDTYNGFNQTLHFVSVILTCTSCFN